MIVDAYLTEFSRNIQVYVAQLAPFIAFKFTSNNLMPSNASNSKAVDSSNAPNGKLNDSSIFSTINYLFETNCIILFPIVTVDQSVSIATKSNVSPETNDSQTNRQLIMIVGLFVSFICITLFALWVVARKRRLGNSDASRHTDLEYSKLMSRC